MGTLIQRPSSAPRWMNCAASARLEAQFPDYTSEIAAEGTAAHWLAEMVLTDQFQVEELIDRKAPNDIFITEEMADYVQEYVDAIEAHIRTIPSHYVVEHPLSVLTMDGNTFEGTPDLTSYDPVTKTLTIIDLKYGWGLVDVFENWQLICYAWLYWCSTTDVIVIEHVNFRIHQPRPHHPDGRIRDWLISLEGLKPYFAQIEAVLRAPTTTVTSGKWCRDCAAIGRCPSAHESILAALQIISNATLEDYTPDTLASEMYMLEIATVLVKSRAEAIDALGKEEVKAGKVIPGWALAPGTGREKWNNGVNVENLDMVGNLIKIPLTKPKPLTPTQARKAGAPQALIDQLSYTPQTEPKFTRHNPGKILERMK